MTDRSSPDPLVDLVAEALDLLEEHGPGAVDAFLREHPAEASTVRRRLALLSASGLDTSVDARATVPERLGDFRLESPIGQGGMGVVWRARQLSLDREVALKLVRPDQLLFPGARERFRREVETVARLEHPGIVPVFAVGEEGDLPYFAMELVRGASLAECLRTLVERGVERPTGEDLRATLPADGSGENRGDAFFAGSWSDVVARIGREVAEALEHAARRGVVHRDVKPSNVMLTRGGRVLLLDFGLSSTEADARLTRTGSAVGSLAYMAPELFARPRSTDAEGDPRQDVYSLGVTLYELYALEPAIEADTEAGLVEAASRGRIRPLAERAPHVPRDLAAVVAVATDRDPARRYPTSGDLARDLGAVLERRPIEARPPGAVLRAVRWTQRHPVLAVVAAAALVGPSLLFAQELRSSRRIRAKNVEVAEANELLEGANDELRATNEELERKRAELTQALTAEREARGRADRLLTKSIDAVDAMLVRVGDEELASIPGMAVVRKELLEEALGFQEWFLAEIGPDERLRGRAVDVALRAAQVQEWLGEDAAMQASVARAEQLAREALEANGPQSWHLRRLLATLSMKGQRHLIAGRVDEAMAVFEEYLALCEDLDEEWYSEKVADGLVQWATCHMRRGELVVAVESLETAGALYDEERAVFTPGDGRWRGVTEGRGLVHRQLSAILSSPNLAPGALPDDDATERAFEEQMAAVAIFEEMLAVEPHAADVKLNLSRSLSSAAATRINGTRSLEVAREHLPLARRSIEIIEELCATHPGVAVYLNDLASFSANLASLEYNIGDRDRAVELADRAVEACAEYGVLVPDQSPLDRVGEGHALIVSGWYRAEHLGEHEAGLARMARGLGVVEQCLERSPTDPLLRGTSARLLQIYTTQLLKVDVRDLATRFFRGLVATAADEPQRLDAFAHFDRYAPHDPERIAEVLGTVLEEQLAAGTVARESLLADPRLANLRRLPRVALALGD